jgi:hypothetical protein
MVKTRPYHNWPKHEIDRATDVEHQLAAQQKQNGTTCPLAPAT